MVANDGVFFVKIVWKIYKTPVTLLHAARRKARQTGVRPAVDLSWKALAYSLVLNQLILVWWPGM